MRCAESINGLPCAGVAFKSHQIKNYQYSFDARAGGPGRLVVYGDAGKIADIRFVADISSVPDPVITADLNSADVWFKRSAFAGVIDLLRNQKPVRVVIDDQGHVDIVKAHGLVDSLVVCSTCDAALVAAKASGVREAMRQLIDFCGADASADICPITFHLDGDGACGPYEPGDTGGFSLDLQGRGQICLFDVEKENRSLPFTVANAQLIEDQLLPVHEAMHAWFVGRQQTYRIQEPFCKLVSFVISKMPGGPDYCGWFSSTADDHPDVLMKYLCEIGMTTALAAQVLSQTAESAAVKGSALTDVEFAEVVTSVLGQDAVPAFQSAGILP